MFQLGEVVLDDEAYELHRDGKTIALQPRICELLAFLIRHSARVVSKEELLEHVWKQRIISDSAIFRCVSLARSAFNGRDWIKVVPGRGYRWIGPTPDPTRSSPDAAAAPLPAPQTEGAALRPAHPPLVGRKHELSAAERAIADLSEGRGGLILLSGAPGIGKTRVALEMMRGAQARGVFAAWGRCVDEAIAPNYWPWHEVWKTLRRAERVSGDLNRAALAVRERFGSALSTEFAICEAFEEALRDAALEQPIAIVIENLHCADLASLWLFEFLGQRLGELPVLLIGTFRSKPIYDDALRLPSIARLLRTNAALSFELCELSSSEAAALLNIVCTCPLDPELAVRVHRLTAGNPFLLTQLAPLLSAAVPCSELTAALPTAIHLALKHELDVLDSDTRTLLAAAAPFGDRIDARQLSRYLRRPYATVVDQLHAAARLGVLRLSNGAACFTFAHELLRNWLVRGSSDAAGGAEKSSATAAPTSATLPTARSRAATPAAALASDVRAQRRAG